MNYTGPLVPITIFADPLVGAASAVAAPGLMRASHDLSGFGGAGRIAGDVKQIGSPDAPVWRRVRLLSQREGLVIGEMWSDPVTGLFAFDWVNPGVKYTLIAYDHTGAYQAVVSDDPTVDPMP